MLVCVRVCVYALYFCVDCEYAHVCTADAEPSISLCVFSFLQLRLPKHQQEKKVLGAKTKRGKH